MQAGHDDPNTSSFRLKPPTDDSPFYFAKELIPQQLAASAIPSPLPEEHHGNQDITLLWGVNVTASVLGTVITATTSMVIGFNGNLLIGFGLYLGALEIGRAHV